MRIAVARETDPAEAAGRRDARDRQEADRRSAPRSRSSRAPASSPAFSMPTTRRPARPSRPMRVDGRRRRAEGAPARPRRARRATSRARSSSPSWTRTATRPRSRRMAEAGVTAFAMELMPRITRAQSMDVLSSQANLAGYRAVIDARGRIRPRAADDDDGGRHRAGRARSSSWASASPACRRSRPRAGSARVVTATDVRPAAKEQVAEPRRQVPRGRGRGVQAGRDRRRLRQGNVEGVPGQAGRARRRAHQEAGHRHHHRADPRPAGAAADLDGDGRLDEAGLGDRRSRGRARRQCRRRASRARSPTSTASRSSATSTCRAASPPRPRASTPRTCYAFLETLIDKKTKALAVNWDDEIVKATALTRDGAVVHPNFLPKTAA